MGRLSFSHVHWPRRFVDSECICRRTWVNFDPSAGGSYFGLILGHL